ncbi:MAG: DUF2726 domain-containing protein [Burkholderiales bacterium]|nr:DUF2726 domain-containing protein [Phycisphaerae bacterium]
MPYRNYKHRKPRRTKQSHRSTIIKQGLADEAVEGIFSLISAMFRGIGRTIALLWRKALKKPNHPPPGPPLPYRDASVAGPARDLVQLTNANPPALLPYRRASRLLSKGEWAIWHPLFHAVRGKYRIFCKVRLADVVSCPRKSERYWFRKIGRYHVDFVLCDPRSTMPLLVIELDDRGHRQPKRKAHDEFKDAVLRAAGVPIYRVPAQQAYDPAELSDSIERLITGSSPSD